MPLASRMPADPDRPLARQAGDRHQASHALGDLVDPGAALIGPVLAEAGNAAVDDARVDLLHRLVVDAEPVLDRGLEVLDDDIGLCRQFHEDFEPLLAFQVEGDRALVAVQVLEVGAVAAAAGRVGMLAGRLDLDHIGAPVRKLPHRGRAGAVGGQVDHRKAIERQRCHRGSSWAWRIKAMLEQIEPRNHSLGRPPTFDRMTPRPPGSVDLGLSRKKSKPPMPDK
jgi:hypothetical protein